MKDRGVRMTRTGGACLVAVLWLAVVVHDPVRAQIMVVGSSVQEEETTPGERYTGEIRLRNQGSDPKPVRIYQTDYFFQADGTNQFPAAGSHPRSNGEWITVSPTDLVVPGGEEMDVTYEVTVPAHLDLAGTYWSMIMVEPTEAITDAPEDPDRPAIGVRTTVRFGIQIATHVGGEAEHRLRLGDPRVTIGDDGGRHLRFELVNEGDVGYRPNVSVEMYDEMGTLVATLEAQRGLIYPGTSALQRFDLSELPRGAYEAVVVVDTGALQVFGAQFTLSLGSSD